MPDIKSTLSITLSAVLLLSCATPQKAEQSLRKVKIDDDLTIAMAADMKQVPVQGIDSLVMSFKNSESVLSFDYGAYSGDLNFFENVDRFSMRQTTVSGRQQAKIAHFYNPADSEYPYYSEISIRNVRRGETHNGFYSSDSAKHLLLTIRCRSKECQSRSEAALRAIEVAPE